MKLEKIEFSGIKGKALGQQVMDMYEEFQEAYKVFAERTYDCLELTNTVGGTSLRERQQHVHASKAAASSVVEPWLICSPADFFPGPFSFCYDLICHRREQGAAGFSCRDLGVPAGLYLAYLARSGPLTSAAEKPGFPCLLHKLSLDMMLAGVYELYQCPHLFTFLLFVSSLRDEGQLK